MNSYFQVLGRNLLAVSIFYGLPVLQLVFTYQKVLNVTGDLDICYYNFNCAHPLGPVTSFNNVFSNIGYVLLGILFIILVWRRNLVYPSTMAFSMVWDLALIMEGVMSACYHICPNYSNFQFDTSFMYIIACLCMLKIYQTRHPDISAKAHTSYLIMALVIFIAVIGVIYSSSVFWVIFAVVDMTFYLVLSIHIYYMGRWKIGQIGTSFLGNNSELGIETPAVSREGNRNCIVLNFYDAHDVWHMLSAIALFFSFLILLTIDDDLFSTKREKILVF
ncbi:hypothetical protein FSP39_005310 [Pinctada imbricata]|uniref:Uncharacterized protein n=1 Tax=Pinctada imbricata TaxID=66713 RepID=A0AA89BUI4_PINIB|nr:hypothetical protein FSP39_005310 [Pinctada imbricata]